MENYLKKSHIYIYIYIYKQLNHFYVYLKLTQYHKPTVLQLKIFFLKMDRLELNRKPIIRGFPGGANDKEPVCQCRRLKKTHNYIQYVQIWYIIKVTFKIRNKIFASHYN